MDDNNDQSYQNDTWFTKYKPETVNDLIGNKKSISLLSSWLKTFELNKKKSLKEMNDKTGKKKRSKKQLTDEKEDVVAQSKKVKNIFHYSSVLLTGNHGIGKSVALDVIIKELGYTVQIINSHIKTKNTKDVLKHSSNSSDVLGLMNGDAKEKKVVVIDKIETITSSTEKNYILSLLKENSKLWCYPIVFLSNNNHNKLLSDIKKISYEIKFYNPFDSEMISILVKIAKGEKMKFQDKNVINGIIDYSQQDIRRLIFILQDIKYTYGNCSITSTLLAEYKDISKQKDIDYDLFNAAEGLLYKYENIDNCLRYYETEKVLLPLMIHQYYPQCIIWNHKGTDHQYDLATRISDSLSWGDIVENLIYGDQNWNMQEIHGFYTCVNTSFYLSDKQNKDIKKCSLQFAADLNKTSIKRINKKNINNASKCFRNMNIMDYIYINKIIRKLITMGDIKGCVELFKGYEVKLEHIESLLKIDKIKPEDSSGKSNKLTLTSKQKKEFMSYLE